ncbi:YaaA family protein [Proteiniclasticum sp. QWL-01]|uniref:YaaA family protein n=1 Tax=Proteiniclasticum sp. QWL-01 TaxID=3036945 RepID=UPI00241155C2|nr:YaaA family protein [Proteiniclasticum sp. QWL-01]WFF74157.1 YaaA family protein [Proteiniclasticum sp. QWL-01]
MIAVLSPAKTMREETFEIEMTRPRFASDASKLVSVLKKKDVSDLMSLMKISEKLAIQNYDRFHAFSRSASYPAGWLFNGDVFNGLAIDEFDASDLDYAEDHLRILSGLYGILRLRDGIKPYRLEMGTRLVTDKGNDLYEFWGNKVSKELVKSPQADLLVNLASKEYSRVLHLPALPIPVLTVEFMEIRSGKPVGIPLFSKKARGLMARYMAKTKAAVKKDLKSFDYEGYTFSEELSDDWTYVFTR